MSIKGINNDIHPDAKIADSAMIWSFNYIGNNVVIEDNVKIGNGCRINSDCIIQEGCNLQDGVILNSGTIVGKDTFISLNVLTTDEKYPTKQTQDYPRKPCKIGSKVVIGAGVILNSVDIGDGAIIGAGANVLKDVKPFEMWYGNPAKCQGTRDDFDKKQFKEMIK